MYEAAHKFLEPKDYLNLRLTGEFASTYEAITLHWVTDNRDPYRIRYDPDLLAAAGLERAQLPDLLPATAVLGRLRPAAAEELGLRPETHVVAGTPDIHAAAIGSGGTRDLDPHLYVGTSSWLSAPRALPEDRPAAQHGLHPGGHPRPLPGRQRAGDRRRVPAPPAGPARRPLRPDAPDPDPFGWARASTDEEAPDEMTRLINLAAGVPAGSDGLLFTPWLVGERTPVEDPWVRGGFHNLTLRTTRGHLVRAVLEGVALNARWLAEAVDRFVGRRLEPVRLIGGGARSELWCQIYADVLDRAVHQMERPLEANVRGAGLLAVGRPGRTELRRRAGAGRRRPHLRTHPRPPPDLRRAVRRVPGTLPATTGRLRPSKQADGPVTGTTGPKTCIRGDPYETDPALGGRRLDGNRGTGAADGRRRDCARTPS